MSTVVKKTHTVFLESTSNEWYTPVGIIERVRSFYKGHIDLDPASCPLAQETVQAKQYFTKQDDGRSKLWHGNVWCNPPYGKQTASFVNKALS